MNELYKSHKSKTLRNWKSRGLIYDDIDDLYYIYINTMECGACKKVFEKTRDRCLDHDHSTGHFRAIVCQKCNVKDTYIRYPNGYTEEDKKEYHKEYYKEWYEKNKEKLKEQQGIKYECECGATISRNSKSRHIKTIKHLSAKNL